MGGGQSKIYVAKESFKPTDDAPDVTKSGYLAFEGLSCLPLFSDL